MVQKLLITDDEHTTDKLEKVFKKKKELSEENSFLKQGWKNHFKEEIKQDSFIYLVRGKRNKGRNQIRITFHLKIPKFLCQNSKIGAICSLERSGKRSRCVSLYFGNLSFQKNGEDPNQKNVCWRRISRTYQQKISLCFGGNACEKTFYSV